MHSVCGILLEYPNSHKSKIPKFLKNQLLFTNSDRFTNKIQKQDISANTILLDLSCQVK